MKRLSGLLFFISFMLLNCFLYSPCLAKSFSITDVTIDCTVQQDTRIRWQESRTFDLRGDFTFGYYDLPMYGYDWFKEIIVGENGKPYQFNESNESGTYWVEHLTDYHRVHYYYQAENEKRTFEYSYMIEGAVDVYEDYGQFYWKMQGEAWGSQVEHFVATIHLEKPISKNFTMIWAHGPLNGVVTKIDDSTFLIEVDYVPAYTYVEIRLLIPSSYFNTDEKESGKIGPTALEEEAIWVKEANAIRIRVIKERKWQVFWQWFWNIVFYSFALFIFLYMLYLYVRYGREYESLKNYDYIREPPEDIPPAEVGYLMKFNKLHPNTVQSILLDLIRRKYIRLETGDGVDFPKEDLVLVQEEEKGMDPLTTYEQTFLFEILFRNALYENQPKTSTSKLQEFIRKSPQKFYAPVEKFKKELKTTVLDQKFFDINSQNIGELIVIICPGLLGFMILFWAVIPKRFIILLPALLLYCWLVGSLAITRRTKKGKEAFDRCLAFKKFLQDFTLLNSVDTNSVIIWEKYLVYAVILGVSRKVIDILRVKLDYMDVSQSNLLNNTNLNWTTSINRLATSTMAVGSTVSALSKSTGSSSYSHGSTHFSSYSGGGGGFSGGGGGGGGGSGGGMG